MAGLIPDAERRLASLREAVASLDVTLRLFDPDANPEDIKPRCLYKRRTGFARRELPRLVADEVRKASTPLSAHAIATLVASGKEIDGDEAIGKQVSATLNAMLRRGAVTRTGEKRGGVMETSRYSFGLIHAPLQSKARKLKHLVAFRTQEPSFLCDKGLNYFMPAAFSQPKVKLS